MSKTQNLKEKQVKNLAEKIKNAKTLMIVSIKSLPSKQFQNIKKSIRESALVQVAKKNILLRTIKELKKESILPLEKYIREDIAFTISEKEGYELAAILIKKRNPAYAKVGQIAPEDIEIKEGPTNLVPGPAISELGNLGIQVAVQDGKLAIKSSKVIVKEGQEISENAASVLQKLNIQPFNVGLEPLAIYDIENEKIYTDIKIDREEAIGKLKSSTAKALGFAQKIVYYCKETISYFLVKANSEENKLSELQPSESITSLKEKPIEADNKTQSKPSDGEEKVNEKDIQEEDIKNIQLNNPEDKG